MRTDARRHSCSYGWPVIDEIKVRERLRDRCLPHVVILHQGVSKQVMWRCDHIDLTVWSYRNILSHSHTSDSRPPEDRELGQPEKETTHGEAYRTTG